MIGFDIDGVLCDSLSEVDKLFEKEVGHKVFANTRTWLINDPTLSHIDINEFLTQSIIDIGNDAKPYPNVIEYISKIHTDIFKHKVIPIITSRHIRTKRITENWLNKYLGEYGIRFKLFFSEYKVDIIRKLELKYFVEDRYETVKLVADNVNKVFMVNRPWNIYERITKFNIVQVNDIKEVYNYLKDNIIL
jgi:uncharacterized HAD superfamily protein